MNQGHIYECFNIKPHLCPFDLADYGPYCRVFGDEQLTAVLVRDYGYVIRAYTYCLGDYLSLVHSDKRSQYWKRYCILSCRHILKCLGCYLSKAVTCYKGQGS